MNCLFIDTSFSSLVVGLIKDDKIHERRIESLNEHSKYLISEIDCLFKEFNFLPKDIDKIFVINGPGSFTGIRIGLTVAKVYGWALNIDVVPISTLHAYALSCEFKKDYYICAMNARRENVYAGIYDSEYNSVFQEKYISINELNENIRKLDNAIVISDVMINEEFESTEPRINIEKIYNYYKNVNGVNIHNLTPNYLKKVEAEEKLGDCID